MDGFEGISHSVNIGIAPDDSSSATGGGNLEADIFMRLIISDLIHQFQRGVKIIRLNAFREELAVFVGAIRQQHASTSGNFKGACGVLVWTNLSKEAEADFGSA